MAGGGASRHQIRAVPVHLDGTYTGAKPRLRHDPDCSHFEWGDGTRLGTPVPAAEDQMRTLHACKSCIDRHGASPRVLAELRCQYFGPNFTRNSPRSNTTDGMNVPIPAAHRILDLLQGRIAVVRSPARLVLNADNAVGAVIRPLLPGLLVDSGLTTSLHGSRASSWLLHGFHRCAGPGLAGAAAW